MSLRSRVAQIIEQVENAGTLREVPNLIKMSGADSFYRVRLGDYRMGLYVAGDAVEFVRFLHRREIYRYFP